MNLDQLEMDKPLTITVPEAAENARCLLRSNVFLQTKKNLKTIHARNSMKGGGQVGC